MRKAVFALVLAPALAGLGYPLRAGEPAVSEARESLAKYAHEPFEQRKREAAIRALGKIGGREAAEALLDVFEDPFVHLQDHAVSAWMTMLKGGRADETRDWLARTALRHKNAGVRRGAAVALGLTRQAGAREAVGQRLEKDRDEGVLSALLGAWPTLGGDAGPVSKLLAHRSGSVALAAAEALVDLGAAASIPAQERARLLRHRQAEGRAGGVLLGQAAGGLTPPEIDAVLADRAPEPKIILLETLGSNVETPADPTRLERLRRLLADESWRVRAAAVRRALEMWTKDVIPLLIERLPQEDGRLKVDLAETLATLTGKTELGWDADHWRTWWAVKGETLELEHKPPRERDLNVPPAPRSGTAAFFRLPVSSKRLAFLLDCSGSMGNPALGKAVGGPTKMEIARAELAKTLGALDETTAFDVFLYRYPSEYPPQPFMTRAFRKLKACSSRNAKAAITWLAKDRQAPKGWGAFYDALRILIDTEEIDTIFFLSDGRPSRGRYDRDVRLIAELHRDNRFRQVRVHTVLVGESGGDRKFMKALAARTGGRFVDAVPEMEDAGRGGRR